MLKSFSKSEWKNAREIKNVSLMGSNAKIEFEDTDEGLKVTTTDFPADEMAVVFKIELE